MEPRPDVLDELREAVWARQLAEERTRELVRRARASARSWRDIAEALGVTYQSAHRRFRSLDPPKPEPDQGEDDRRRHREEFRRLHGHGPYSSR